MKPKNFNSNFTLNGKSFSTSDEIIRFSEEITASLCQFLKEWFSDADAILAKTSGSTGKPKRIHLKKTHMINSAKMTGEFFNYKENSSALLCLSTDYIAGKMMLVRALTLGWELDVVAPTSNPLKNNVKEYDFTAFVPLQLENSLLNIHQIKTLLVGGGKVSNALQAKIQHIETEVFATYGMTETSTHIAIKKLNNFIVVSSGAVEKPFFKVLPNINIAKDKRNCLVINAPKLSNETIVTNDMVELISSTEFKLLGRYDNVINSGGIKLHPEIIEDKLASYIPTRFFVIGIPDAILGEKLVLIIEQNLISSEAEKSQKLFLKTEIKKVNSLSKFEIPKEIYIVPKFLETETGKVQRNKTLKQIFTN